LGNGQGLLGRRGTHGLHGAVPGTTRNASGDAVVDRWRALLPGFDGTQHINGPVLETDDGGPGVRADSHVRAYHRLGEETWAVFGHYVARVVDGRISELTLQLFYQEGNPGLAAMATERASTSPRSPRALPCCAGSLGDPDNAP